MGVFISIWLQKYSDILVFDFNGAALCKEFLHSEDAVFCSFKFKHKELRLLTCDKRILTIAFEHSCS